MRMDGAFAGPSHGPRESDTAPIAPWPFLRTGRQEVLAHPVDHRQLQRAHPHPLGRQQFDVACRSEVIDAAGTASLAIVGRCAHQCSGRFCIASRKAAGVW
jgi:hypothetical protein